MIFDKHGKPISGMTVAELAQTVGQDMQQVFQVLAVMQRGMVMSEMKVNFLIEKLKAHSILDEETLDTEWQEFVAEQRKEMESAQRAQEIAVVPPTQVDLSL